MAIKLSENIFIKRGSRPSPLSKYETKDLNDMNSIPYPIQSDIEKNNIYLSQYKKKFKTNLGYNFSPSVKGDLLMTSSCDIGNVVILNLEKAFIDDKFFNLKTSPLLKKSYLKYWIIKNKKEISELGYGTTFNVLYIEPFIKYLDKKFVPDLRIQQEIINIIEPFEKLKEKVIVKIQKLNSIFINFEDDKVIKSINLKNVSSIKTGNKNANYTSDNGIYRFFTCSLNKIQYCNSFEYNDEVILLAGNGEIGEVKYFNGKFDAYQRTYIIKTNLIGNVYYSLLNSKKFFENNSKGSVVKFLTLSTIQNIKVNTDKNKNYIRYKMISLLFKYEQILLNLYKIIKLLIELYLI